MRTKTILLVEPEEEVCRAIKALVESLGYEVVAVGDVDAAVEVFPYVEADLVITAHPLPTAEGVDFASEVKRLAPHTQVIGILRRGLREVARDALTYGCDDIVSKPVVAELLSLKLRHLIGSPEGPRPIAEH